MYSDAVHVDHIYSTESRRSRRLKPYCNARNLKRRPFPNLSCHGSRSHQTRASGWNRVEPDLACLTSLNCHNRNPKGAKESRNKLCAWSPKQSPSQVSSHFLALAHYYYNQPLLVHNASHRRLLSLSSPALEGRPAMSIVDTPPPPLARLSPEIADTPEESHDSTTPSAVADAGEEAAAVVENGDASHEVSAPVESVPATNGESVEIFAGENKENGVAGNDGGVKKVLQSGVFGGPCYSPTQLTCSVTQVCCCSSSSKGSQANCTKGITCEPEASHRSHCSFGSSHRRCSRCCTASQDSVVFIDWTGLPCCSLQATANSYQGGATQCDCSNCFNGCSNSPHRHQDGACYSSSGIGVGRCSPEDA